MRNRTSTTITAVVYAVFLGLVFGVYFIAETRGF